MHITTFIFSKYSPLRGAAPHNATRSVRNTAHTDLCYCPEIERAQHQNKYLYLFIYVFLKVQLFLEGLQLILGINLLEQLCIELLFSFFEGLFKLQNKQTTTDQQTIGSSCSSSEHPVLIQQVDLFCATILHCGLLPVLPHFFE